MFTSEDENHRRRFDFKYQVARTTLKQMCISVVGVKIWNSQLQDLKGCTDIHRFKKKCTNAEKVVNMHSKLKPDDTDQLF